MLRQDDYQRTKLVESAWNAGKEYGGYLASCMIMSCIANRHKFGWGSWLDIIKNIPKYSATFEQPNDTPNIWEPEFVKLLQEVDGIFDHSKDYAKGAVYWADLRHIETPFFKDKILAYPEIHPRIGDLNSLTLFK